MRVLIWQNWKTLSAGEDWRFINYIKIEGITVKGKKSESLLVKTVFTVFFFFVFFTCSFSTNISERVALSESLIVLKC